VLRIPTQQSHLACKPRPRIEHTHAPFNAPLAVGLWKRCGSGIEWPAVLRRGRTEAESVRVAA
jgi:hypothetical protein